MSHPAAVVPAEPVRRWYQRLGWLGILVGGVVAYIVVLLTMVSTQNPVFFPTLLLVGAVTVPMAVLAFAWGIGRTSLIPGGWVVSIAVTGGIIGTVAAGILEYRTLQNLSAGAMMLVGLIEETVKLIVPLIVLVAVGRRYPRAGVIVGVASGMGFATLETMGYGFATLLQARSVAAVDQTLLLRALLSPAGHVAWTGLVCASLWHVRNAPSKAKAFLEFVGIFVLAVALHSLWDGTSNLGLHIAIVLISVILLLVAIVLANRRDAPVEPAGREQLPGANWPVMQGRDPTPPPH